MNKLFLFLIIILLFFYNRYIYKETFKNEDLTQNLYLLDDEEPDVNKAILQNINNYIVSKEYNFKALKFNGINSRLIIKNIDTKNFTLSFYFKIMDHNNKALVYSKSGGWKIEIINKIVKVIVGGDVTLSDNVIDLNKWYNLALIVNSGGSNLHINGIEHKKAFAYDLTTKDIVFGTTKSKKLFFNGYIGKIKIYNRSLERDELCHLSKMCKIIDPNKSDTCAFLPKGENLSDCVKDCKDTENCDLDYCQNVCKGCIDYDQCKWIQRPKPPVEEVVKKPKNFPPYAPLIRGHQLDKKVSLEWARPYDGGSPINQYLIMVYEKFNPEKGVKLSVSSDPECEECEHVISGLKNSVFYDISVRAVNNIGLGDISNIISLSPNGPIELDEDNSVFLESDEKINKQVKNEIGYEPNKCVKDFKVNYNPLDYYKSFPNFMNNIYKKKNV